MPNKKSIPCRLIINTRWGHCCTPMDFPSITAAVRYARGGNGGFAYRVVSVDGKLIRRGFCE